MLGTFCALALTYLLAASFALAENLASKRTLTRGVRAKARIALEAVIWPPEELWLRLRQFCSRLTASAQALQPRYQEVPW
jgi:hypothetical protein